MREFGLVAYQNVAYVNFENNQMMRALFEADFSKERILQAVEAVTGIKPDPDKILIIFDEIQEAPHGLTALKCFCENAPQYHLMAAGSLLGVALHQGSSFPVGKVDFVDLYPIMADHSGGRVDDECTALRNFLFEVVFHYSKNVVSY